MNYISEIISFHKYTALKPLPGATQSLWFLLLEINNKCLWIEWFKVSNMRLANRLCMSEKTLIKHRDILVENGLIFYKSQKRKKNSGEYKIVSLSVQFSNDFDENAEKSTVKIPVDCDSTVKTTVEIPVDCDSTIKSTVKIPVDYDSTVKSTVKIPVDCDSTVKTTVEIPVDCKTTVKITDIDKQKTISSSTTTMQIEFKNLIQFFEENFYETSSYEKNKFNDWLKTYDFDVLILALEESLKNGIKTYKYVEGILNNWKRGNLKNIDEIKDHMLNYSSKNISRSTPGKVTPISSKNKFHQFEKGNGNYSEEELERKLGIRK